MKDSNRPLRTPSAPAIAGLLLLAATVAATGAGAAESEAAGAPADGPYFVNVTAGTGLAGKPGFRLSIADVNNDGYPDILLHRQANYGTADWMNKQYLYLNVRGDDPDDPFSRKFTDHTAASNIRANRSGTSSGRHTDGAVFADVDNDGDLDMFTPVYVHDNYAAASDRNDLMLNDGTGTFTLAPSSSFHTEILHNTAAAVFVEYDNDGKVDLFIGNWYRPASTLTVDQLYKGNGDGTFTNVTGSAGLTAGSSSVYGIAAFDSNDDGFTDLFSDAYSWTVFPSRPLHWRNNGNGTFTRVEASTNYDDYRGFASQRAAFGSMPRDFDNDGDADFLEILTHGVGDGAGQVHSTAVANVAGVFSWDFYRVSGRGAEDPDLTHHGDHYASWFDYDGDGLVDFALTESGYNNNRLYLFRQASNNTFSPVTVQSGLNGINDENLPPHNVMPLDYDLDGDEDLLVGFANDSTGIRLYENIVGTDNNWLVVTLRGGGGAGQANRSAIGAKVSLTAGATTWTREVYAGNGHLGPQVPLSLHFGLGAAALADSITVRWPNQALSTKTLTNVPVNRFVTICEVGDPPGDPANLRARRDGADVVLSWDDPAAAGTDWNVYRDADPRPWLWGGPHAAGVTDGEPGEPGIQHRDAGAAAGPDSFHYLITARNSCSESPLR